MKLIPYVEVNGCRTLSDDKLKGIFKKIQKQKLFDVVFCDGLLQTDNDFVDMMKSDINCLVVVEEGKEPIALSWINNITTGKANIHFVMFREIWGERTQEIGQKVLKYFFGTYVDADDQPLFKILWSVPPSFNKKAIEYAKKLGFVDMGTIPYFIVGKNKLIDANIMYKVNDIG